MNTRKIALKLLTEWQERGTYINLVLESVLAEDTAKADRGFLTALLYGTVERRLTLDYYIGILTKKRAEELRSHTVNLLRLGLYQLLFMEGVPPYAAVSETVSLAGDEGERRFVNGVLRAALRERERLLPPEREKDVLRYLSIRYSVPRPIVKSLVAEYGEAPAEQMLAFFNTPRPLTLRVNTLRVTRERMLQVLREQGVSATPCRYSPVGIRVEDSIPPTALAGFAEGWFYVQDESSQIAVEALGAKAGERVMDVCACPGGKILGAAINAEGVGEFRAFDLHESKLSLIEASAARLGVEICAVAADATVLRQKDTEWADRLICDVPCSGLGVLGQKPDLRYHPREAAQGGQKGNTLPALQAEILETASAYLCKGGRLLYSTCTLLREENSAVVEAFLARHTEFAPVDFTVGELSSEKGMLQLLPHIHGTDGFFMALLEKR